MNRTLLLTVLLAAGALSIAPAGAQDDPTLIRMQKVKDRLYVITGGRPPGLGVSGNTEAFITDSGVVLVDSKYPGFGKAIMDQVKTVTDKPIIMIINTHAHLDHTSGNKEFPRTVDLVAQENTKTNMAKMDAFQGDNAAFLPKKTFKDRMSLLSGKDRIDLYHFGPAHTDGDTVVVFPALRTAVLGDFFSRKSPGSGSEQGGSTVEYAKTLAKAVAALKNVDTVITGHSTVTLGPRDNMSFVKFDPVMKFSDLQDYAEFMRELAVSTEASMRAGKSVDEAVAAMKFPDKYKDYIGKGGPKGFVERYYEESKH